MTAAAFGIVGGAGVLVLLLAESRVARLAGLAAVAAGMGGLAAWLVNVSRLVDDATRRPALAAAGVVIALAALAIGTALLLRAPWLVAFAALLAGWARVPVHVGGQDASLLVPLYGVLACAWLALAVEAARGRPRPALGPAIGLPLGLYVLWAGASLGWSADTRQGAVTVLFFLLPFGVLAAALGGLASGARPLAGLLRLDVALAALFAAVGLYQAVTHTYLWHNPKLVVANLYASFFRVSSVFYDPSIYGRFLAVAIVLAAAALLFGRVERPLVAAVAMAVAFAGIAVSYSQSSYVSLAVGLLGAAALAWGWKPLAALVAAGLVIVAVAALAAPQLAGFRRDVTHGNLGAVTSTRSGLASTGGRLFVHHPAVGVGLGGFLQAAKPKHNANARGAKGASHIMPLTVAAELGLPGLVLLAWLLAALARASLAGPGPPEQAGHRLALGLALLVILVHSLFYAAFFEDPLMWGLLGLLAAAARRPARERRSGIVRAG